MQNTLRSKFRRIRTRTRTEDLLISSILLSRLLRDKICKKCISRARAPDGRDTWGHLIDIKSDISGRSLYKQGGTNKCRITAKISFRNILSQKKKGFNHYSCIWIRKLIDIEASIDFASKSLLTKVPARVVRPPAGPAAGAEARGGGGAAVSGATCGRSGAQVLGGVGDDGWGVGGGNDLGAGFGEGTFKVFGPGGGL
jgi:hypothetical protein